MEVAKLTNVTRIYKIGEVETRALNGVSMTIGDG
ncbi:MAG: ABC transporter ATP-binding protein, partial [Chloroflexi bacterium]